MILFGCADFDSSFFRLQLYEVYLSRNFISRAEKDQVNHKRVVINPFWNLIRFHML